MIDWNGDIAVDIEGPLKNHSVHCSQLFHHDMWETWYLDDYIDSYWQI